MAGGKGGSTSGEKKAIEGGGMVRHRIRLRVMAAKMRDAFVKIWDYKNIIYFIGSVGLMHFYGDELAV